MFELPVSIRHWVVILNFNNSSQAKAQNTNYMTKLGETVSAITVSWQQKNNMLLCVSKVYLNLIFTVIQRWGYNTCVRSWRHVFAKWLNIAETVLPMSSYTRSVELEKLFKNYCSSSSVSTRWLKLTSYWRIHHT